MRVRVLNVNDNAPEFSRSEYELRVVENLEPGSIVGQVLATDLDGDLISYTLSTDVKGTAVGKCCLRQKCVCNFTTKQKFRLENPSQRTNGSNISCERSDGDIYLRGTQIRTSETRAKIGGGVLCRLLAWRVHCEKKCEECMNLISCFQKFLPLKKTQES